jgi:hypothetical protein
MSLLKPKNGMFRHFRGIRTLINEIDEQKYQKMLPKTFEPHDIPQISLFVADYIKVFPWPLTRYQEGAVSLNCKYRGDDYWYVFTMPVTRLVPMWGGRKMGYPKYIANEIVLKQEDDKWVGKVMHKNRCKLCLSFTAGLDREPRESEKTLLNERSFFMGKSINLCPPSQGSAVNTVNLEHMVEANWNPSYGMIKVDVDVGEEIDGLFDKKEKYIGMYNEFIGGINLNPQRLS